MISKQQMIFGGSVGTTGDAHSILIALRCNEKTKLIIQSLSYRARRGDTTEWAYSYQDQIAGCYRCSTTQKSKVALLV